MLDFCTDVKQITKFVNGVKCTGGGDLPEAYELALRDAQKLKWRLRSAKALVMVRQDTLRRRSLACSLSRADRRLSPASRELHEREGVVARGAEQVVQRAGLQGLRGAGGQLRKLLLSGAWWSECVVVLNPLKELARRSGGVHLPLESFNLITEMFMAVCYKERGVDYLKRFKQELQKDKRLNASLDKVFNKLEHETPPPALGTSFLPNCVN